MPVVVSMACDPAAWLWPVVQSSLGVPDRPLYQVKVTLLAGANPVTRPEIKPSFPTRRSSDLLPLRAASGLSVCTVVAMVRLPLATVNGWPAALTPVVQSLTEYLLCAAREARKA